MHISHIFILELEFQLKRDSFPHECNVKLLERFWEIQIGKTTNRSTLGSMNDMVNCADYLFNSQALDVEMGIAHINRSINTTPFKAIKYKFPIECFAENGFSRDEVDDVWFNTKLNILMNKSTAAEQVEQAARKIMLQMTLETIVNVKVG